MSGSGEWNTKEIRAFKEAFGKRNDRSFFSSEPPHDPNAAFQRARDMLDKRREQGARTWMALADKHDKMQDNGLLRDLASRADELNENTNVLLENDQPPDLDAATQALIQATDHWVAFEARCISAGNALSKAGSDDRLRTAMSEQALETLDLIAPLRDLAGKGGPPPALQQIERELLRLAAMSGGDGSAITDMAEFSGQLQECRLQLHQVTKAVAKSSSDKDAACQLAIKQMYGIDIKPSKVFGFPYEQFLDTLAMVPPDHARNSAMTEVVGEFLGFSTGGDYLASGEGDREGQEGGRIRINPIIDYNVFGKSYKNPGTEEWERIDNWKATTLHEIGHSVDAAYSLMKTHGKEKGCGNWQTQSPLVYMQPQQQGFHNALGHSGVTEPAFTSRIGSDTFNQVLITVAVGNKKPAEMREALQKFWENIYDAEHYPTTGAQEIDDRLAHADGASLIVGNVLLTVFPDGRGAADFDDKRREFMQRVARHVDTLTGGPSLIDPSEFLGKLKDLAENPATPAAGVADWVEKSVADFKDRHRKAQAELKAKIVARWTDAVIGSLPKPVDLKAYLAGSKPWQTDLSNANIGGQPASHEAYTGNTEWWRYGAEDRQSTFVSDYQWRAPGEWFAELYSITWFKKVEPPGGVSQALRPYLYGGSLKPDQAV